MCARISKRILCQRIMKDWRQKATLNRNSFLSYITDVSMKIGTAHGHSNSRLCRNTLKAQHPVGGQRLNSTMDIVRTHRLPVLLDVR